MALNVQTSVCPVCKSEGPRHDDTCAAPAEQRLLVSQRWALMLLDHLASEENQSFSGVALDDLGVEKLKEQIGEICDLPTCGACGQHLYIDRKSHKNTCPTRIAKEALKDLDAVLGSLDHPRKYGPFKIGDLVRYLGRRPSHGEEFTVGYVTHDSLGQFVASKERDEDDEPLWALTLPKGTRHVELVVGAD